jgi:hypothetical protein
MDVTAIMLNGLQSVPITTLEITMNIADND